MNTRVELPSSSSLDGNEEGEILPCRYGCKETLLMCLPAVSGSVVLVSVIVQGHTFVLNVAKYNF